MSETAKIMKVASLGSWLGAVMIAILANTSPVRAEDPHSKGARNRAPSVLIAEKNDGRQPKSPLKSTPVRTTTHQGIPLDEPISVRVRDVLVRIPAGYLWPWPAPTFRGRVNDWKGLGFQFWMPDRRYVEIAPGSIIGFRPQEAGRPPPAPDAYIVNVRDFKPVKLDDPDYRSPQKGFENYTSTPGIASYSFEQENFGLVRYWRHDSPYPPHPEAFLNYRHAENTDPQVLLHCNPDIYRPYPTSPLCAGDIYFAADELGFFVYFPRDELPHWREIVTAARDLFRSWKAAQ
jgi:hypothetical protein